MLPQCLRTVDSRHRSVVDSLEIFLCLGVDADLFTLLDEDGDPHSQTGFGGDELRRSGDRVALDGLLGLGDEIDDLARNLDVEDFLVVDGATEGFALFHDELVVGEGAHRNRHVLERLGIHEVEVLPVVVLILEVLVGDGDVLGVVLALHRLGEHLTGGRALELQSYECRAFARIHEFTVDADERLPLDQQRRTFVNLSCFYHKTPRMQKIELSEYIRKAEQYQIVDSLSPRLEHQKPVKAQGNPAAAGE